MDFYFLSPGVGRNMQDRLAGCLIPYSTLSHCNIPRTPLRLPCSPAEVSLLPGFSRQPATAAPCRGCRSYFSFSCYGSLFNLHQSPATYLSAGKYFSAKLSPHHLYRCPGYFVSLKVFSPADCHNHEHKITVKIGKIPPYCYSVFKVLIGLSLPACQNTSYYFLRCLLTDLQQPVYILWHYLFSNS